MCKAEPHGILVAERGSHLLIPEVSHFVANFTIRWCTVACAHQAQEQSDFCSQFNLWQSEMKGNIPRVLLDPTQSKGHPSIMCSRLGTTEEAMLGTLLAVWYAIHTRPYVACSTELLSEPKSVSVPRDVLLQHQWPKWCHSAEDRNFQESVT